MNILLLDIDGTLIHDRGYRHAMRKTIEWVGQQRGLPTHAPAEQEINVLHSCGYSNEWDSVPFSIGINMLMQHLGDNNRPDFAAWARRSTEFNGLPNERARDLLLHESPAELHTDIHALLDEVQDPRLSITTRAIYEFVLGSERFAKHFDLPPLLNSESYLATLDKPLLNDTGREIVLRHAATTYTARPSLPPDNSRAGLYQTPEAEIALEQLGISQLPNMGLGPMQWLADQFGGNIWDYAKPAATQSIAALLAATGTPLTDAATAAYQFTHMGRANELVCGLDGAVACVFEDNAGGVRGCQKAAAALAERGIHVIVRGFGIATDPAKRAALAQVCEGVYDDVNVALNRVDSE
ncbi:MAG: hypothetical protein KIH69_019385 [Anaerolineae bacterium]|nr:hypothetical protein [Anaerolineae bacterium]